MNQTVLKRAGLPFARPDLSVAGAFETRKQTSQAARECYRYNKRATIPKAIMFRRGTEKKFLGLKGFHLNIAIGLIAGLDFLYSPSTWISPFDC